MIAIDTSTWIAFLSQREPSGNDTALLESALADRQACLPPVVLTELLSDPKLPAAVAALVAELPVLHPDPGYWQRAGALQAKVIARRRRARLADTLIAQSCLDHRVRLVTREADFRHSHRSADYDWLCDRDPLAWAPRALHAGGALQLEAFIP